MPNHWWRTKTMRSSSNTIEIARTQRTSERRGERSRLAATLLTSTGDKTATGPKTQRKSTGGRDAGPRHKAHVMNRWQPLKNTVHTIEKREGPDRRH